MAALGQWTMACMLCMWGLKFAKCHRQHHQYNVWIDPLAKFPFKENATYLRYQRCNRNCCTEFDLLHKGPDKWAHTCVESMIDLGSFGSGRIQKLRAAISRECWPETEKLERQVETRNLRLHGDSWPPYAWTANTSVYTSNKDTNCKTVRIPCQLVFTKKYRNVWF